MDQSKKTMRHFYCRDVLWETFEQMANDFDCSIDYLVNEAMRFYARSKNYQAGTVPPSAAPSSGGGNGAAAGASAPPAPPARARPPIPPPPASQAGTAMRPQIAPAPPARKAAAAPIASSGQPALARSEPGLAGGPTLYLMFNNQRITIDKDQFIIGRGSKSSDLPIKDGNISRKHAAVIRRNGMFYIKDLGSTNGIDYKGMRIDNKRIDEGDVFHLCDYELRFSYR